jgi:hypothetical protein
MEHPYSLTATCKHCSITFASHRANDYQCPTLIDNRGWSHGWLETKFSPEDESIKAKEILSPEQKLSRIAKLVREYSKDHASECEPDPVYLIQDIEAILGEEI